MGAIEALDCDEYKAAIRCDTQEERDNNDLDVEPVVVLGISFSLRR